jgi:hypothetical protein
MKATLIKKAEGWYNLYQDKIGIGSTYPELQGYKLSKQNCDEIFGVTDIEKLAHEFSQNLRGRSNLYAIMGFDAGFSKAMELNKDKQFTLEDVLNAYMEGTNDGAQFESLMDYDSEDFDEAHEFAKEAEREFRESIQQPTEIEVEIEMEKVVDETKVVGAVKGVKGSGDKITTYKAVPKLDAEGCIILKKAR